MTAPMKVDASVSKLIATLETKAAENKKEYEQRMVKWQARMDEWVANEIARHQDAIKKLSNKSAMKKVAERMVDSGEERWGATKPMTDYLDWETEHIPQPPSAPACYSQRLEWLRTADKDLVKMSLDDYAQYTRGCF